MDNKARRIAVYVLGGVRLTPSAVARTTRLKDQSLEAPP